VGDDLREDSVLAGAPLILGHKVLPPCVLYGKLGEGGMGAVYLARHLNLGIDVAVKCLRADVLSGERMVERFQQEARVAARINHPNLVRVYDVLRDFGVYYLVMEFVRGETAGDRVYRTGAPLPEAEAAKIFHDAALALAELHDRGIVHRDIKPPNLLISVTGEVKVADLGLARPDSDETGLTKSGIALGTPAYMPPEQWEDPSGVGPPCDVWALGATAWYLLAGKPAIPSTTWQVALKKICHDDFPDIVETRPEISEELAEILRRATRREPADRYASARDLVAALEPFLRENPPPSLACDLPIRESQAARSEPTEEESDRIRAHLERSAESGVPLTVQPIEEGVEPTVAGGGSLPATSAGAPGTLAGTPGTIVERRDASARRSPLVPILLVFVLLVAGGGIAFWQLGARGDPGPGTPPDAPPPADPPPDPLAILSWNPKSGAVVASPSVRLWIRANRPVAAYRIGSGDWLENSPVRDEVQHDLALAPGPSTVRIWIRDSAGNVSEDELKLELTYEDRRGPQLTKLPADTITDLEQTLLLEFDEIMASATVNGVAVTLPKDATSFEVRPASFLPEGGPTPGRSGDRADGPREGSQRPAGRASAGRPLPGPDRPDLRPAPDGRDRPPRAADANRAPLLRAGRGDDLRGRRSHRGARHPRRRASLPGRGQPRRTESAASRRLPRGARRERPHREDRGPPGIPSRRRRGLGHGVGNPSCRHAYRLVREDRTGPELTLKTVKSDRLTGRTTVQVTPSEPLAGTLAVLDVTGRPLPGVEIRSEGGATYVTFVRPPGELKVTFVAKDESGNEGRETETYSWTKPRIRLAVLGTTEISVSSTDPVTIRLENGGEPLSEILVDGDRQGDPENKPAGDRFPQHGPPPAPGGEAHLPDRGAIGAPRAGDGRGDHPVRSEEGRRASAARGVGHLRVGARDRHPGEALGGRTALPGRSREGPGRDLGEPRAGEATTRERRWWDGQPRGGVVGRRGARPDAAVRPRG
jgi:serine/threonine protein kinase